MSSWGIKKWTINTLPTKRILGAESLAHLQLIACIRRRRKLFGDIHPVRYRLFALGTRVVTLSPGIPEQNTIHQFEIISNQFKRLYFIRRMSLVSENHRRLPFCNNHCRASSVWAEHALEHTVVYRPTLHLLQRMTMAYCRLRKNSVEAIQVRLEFNWMQNSSADCKMP